MIEMIEIGLGLTGQGLSHSAPCQPALQLQLPSSGLHWAPLAQRQVALQPGPQEPLAQRTEQSNPRQPAHRQADRRVERQETDG